MKQNIRELEKGLGSDGMNNLDMLKIKYESIDFTNDTRELIQNRYYYYLQLGNQKYSILYSLDTDTIIIRKAHIGIDAEEGEIVLEVNVSFLEDIKN
jgi:hypothetical protein